MPNERGEHGLENVRQTLRIIKHTQPRVWFIENSRNILRHLMPALMEEVGVKGVHKTVSYCSYGCKYMKPTDIWTNCESWEPRPFCRRLPNNNNNKPPLRFVLRLKVAKKGGGRICGTLQ